MMPIQLSSPQVKLFMGCGGTETPPEIYPSFIISFPHKKISYTKFVNIFLTKEIPITYSEMILKTPSKAYLFALRYFFISFVI